MSVIAAFLPRPVLQRLLADQGTAWHVNVVVSHAILLSTIAIFPAILPIVGRWPHVCLGRTWTGFDCPGCGITTSIDCLARGDLQRSLTANPAGLVLVIGLALHLLLHAFAIGRWEHRPLCNRISRYIAVSAWTILLIVWLRRVVYHQL